MQPPDMQRLKHIMDYCISIEKTIDRFGDSYEIFSQDEDFQSSVTFKLLQIGELSKGLSEEYLSETSDREKWSDIARMRDMAAHHYGKMDKEIIWNTAKEDVPELKEFCKKELDKI